MTNTFSLLFYIRKSKTKSNGTVPIYVRITINGKRATIMRDVNKNNDIFFMWVVEFYKPKVFFTSPSIRCSIGFSKHSFTLTKKPTDSLPSITL